MKSSCAPYKYCQKGGNNKNTSKTKNKTTNKTTSKNTNKKTFLYNPNDPKKKGFDVYIDKNPNDTIHIKYTTIEDVKNTIRKLEKLYKQKKYTHIKEYGKWE